MKLTKWLFILSLILFPLGEIIRITIAKDIIIKPLDAVVVLTTLSLFFHVSIRGNIKKHQLFWPILYFSGICLLSLVVNASWLSTEQLLTSFSYFVRWVAYAGIFFVVVSFDHEFKKKLLSRLWICGAVFLLLGFIQYIWYPDLRNLYYLGWDEHMYRLFSTVLDPNFAGSFLVLFLLFISSSFLKKITILQKVLLGTLSLITILGILLTYSRSAYLMLLVSGCLFLMLQRQFKILFEFAILLSFFFVVSTRFVTSEGTNLFRTASTLSRLDSYKEAIVIIRSNPLFGVGFNSYKYALEQKNIQKTTKALEQHANTGTDSSLLFVLATTGIIGLVSYLYLYQYLLFNAYMRYKEGSSIALGLLCGLVGLLINSLFINSLFYSFILFWLWVLLGLIEKE